MFLPAYRIAAQKLERTKTFQMIVLWHPMKSISGRSVFDTRIFSRPSM
jgi:hypothetical protein